MGTSLPDVYVLWDDTPLEALGLRGALMSAELVTTVGRTKPSKQFKTGKPKVGGAKLEFELTDRTIASMLARLLMSENRRPTISLAFGYHDDKFYWVGSFLVDKHQWGYTSDGVTKLTIDGKSDKVLGLVENTRPRVFENPTLERITRFLSEEHNLEISIGEDIQGTVTMAYAAKPAQESDWGFLQRMADVHGAIGFSLVSSPVTSAGVSYSQLNQVVRDTRAGLAAMKQQLRISKYPGFMYTSAINSKLHRPLRVAFGPIAKPRGIEFDLLAQSIEVTVEGYKNVKVATGTNNRDNSKVYTLAVSALPLLPTSERGRYINVELGPDGNTFIPPSGLRPSQGQINAGHGYQTVGTTVLPEEIQGAALSASRLAAIAFANKFQMKISVTMNPGVPYIQAPSIIEIYGTDAFDGTWGVEEARTTFDSSRGLITVWTCKPAGIQEQAKKGSKKGEEVLYLGVSGRMLVPGGPRPGYVDVKVVNGVVEGPKPVVNKPVPVQ